jgi:heptose-I-phosphate ethanolaminephosphotransferase
VAICQTNFKEAWYYFWGVNHGVILHCFMVLALVALFFMLKSCRRNLFTISYGNFKIITRFNLLLLIVAFFIFGIGMAANMYLYFRPSTWRTIKAYRRYQYVVNKHNNLMLERQRTRTERSTLAKSEDTPSGIDGLFVLIIGESLDRRYMGCYNPQHKTTPFQSNLKNKQGTVFLNKIYACDVQTTKAVPMMLTLNNQYIQNDKHLFSDAELSLSLLDVAQNNGYDVIWISNQERISTHNSVITAIASSASQCIFMEDVNPKTRFDHEIVSVLQNLVFSKRTLVIVHLMGNHFPYGKTYPHDIPFPDNMTAYEKSVYYNDTVIQQITEYFQAHGALLISYVSDHSDAVSIGKVHDPRPNKFHFEMIEIPMWIWTSQVYSHDYPTIIEQLQSFQNKVLTNDLVFNMYIDLMHFQKDPKIDKYSPFSSDFVLNKEPPLSLNGKFIIPNSE